MSSGARSIAPVIDPVEANRGRLVEGLLAAIADKGYVDTTIMDIVRHARMSKRTFYEHFEDKDACFLASYQAVSERALLAIASAVDSKQPWEHQIHAATRAYLGVLEDNAALTRTFLLEIHAAGSRALKLRREIHQRFADLLRGLVQVSRRAHPQLRSLSPAMAIALVGGINELVLAALEGNRAARLHGIEKTAVDLVRAVLLAPDGDV